MHRLKVEVYKFVGEVTIYLIPKAVVEGSMVVILVFWFSLENVHCCV